MAKQATRDHSPSSENYQRLKKRRVRGKLQEVTNSIAANKASVCNLQTNAFAEHYGDLQNLSKHAVDPPEQLHLLTAMQQLAEGCVEVGRSLLASKGYNCTEVVSAIARNFGGAQAAGVSEEEAVEMDWAAFNSSMLFGCCMLNEGFGVSTMVGPLDCEAKEQKTRAPHERRAVGEKINPDQVQVGTTAENEKETDKNMMRMFEILGKNRRRNIELFALVLNRHSFSQTVENVFSLSFLVKDGKAAIQVKDNRHVVVPKNTPSLDDRENGKAVNSQFVMRVDWADWQFMIKEVPEGEELMPHRSNSQEEDMPNHMTSPIRRTSRNIPRPSVSPCI